MGAGEKRVPTLRFIQLYTSNFFAGTHPPRVRFSTA